MTTKSATGVGTSRDAAQSVREAAAQIALTLTAEDVQFVLVFATVGYAQDALLAEVRSQFPNAGVCGCSAEGVIAQSLSEETDYSLVLMGMASTTLRFVPLFGTEYSDDPAGCGRDLAERINEIEDVFAVLLFPDGVTGNCSEFLQAVREGLPDGITLAGGSAGDSMLFEKTYQYCNSTVLSGAVAAVAFAGPGRLDFAVSHGCAPVGLERKITRAEGGWVYEIDGESAWSVFKEYLVGDTEDLNAEGILHLCIGEKLDLEVSNEFSEYAIRSPMALDKATGALFFPGGCLKTGQMIRLTRRDPIRIRESASACAQGIRTRAGGQAPIAVFQFDCAGRGKAIFGTQTAREIVEPAQTAIGRNVPWVGFHTYGEIAAVAGRLLYHNYTVALCALHEL